ncbi:MAG TPA: glycosyltransferase family 4 protein [Phycisphaerales bacterium]|nr:glycosyltransferase family 4 protein [Phycisphaerales bacterium]
MTDEGTPALVHLSTRPRVAAIVLNSVSHDTRVLKEAASLQAAGYEVTIFGLQDNRCNEPLTVFPNGVRVVRCAWRADSYRLLARLIVVVGVFVAAAIGASFVIPSASILASIKSLLSVPMAQLVLLNVAGVTAIAILVGVLLIKPFRRLMQIARRYQAMEGEPVAAKTARRWSLWGAVINPLSRRVGHWVQSRKIRDSIRSFEPDVVHCHDLNALPIGSAYVGRHGGRLVYDSHEIYEAVSSMKPWNRRWLEIKQRHYSRRVELFITINDSIAEYLNRKYPKLPTAVVVKNAAPAPKEPIHDDGRLHAAANLDPQTRILLYQGGFARHRGLSILLKAAPLLPDGWALVMMGWGAIESELRSLAAKIDPEGLRIRFIPGAPLEELPQWTAGASLGVIPYENVCLNHWFCTPNKLWEYPIANVPILASPFPELRRVIETYDIGVLMSDPITPESIAGAVVSMNDAEFARLRMNCTRFTAEDHWNRYGRILVKAYHELIGANASSQVNFSAESPTTV